MFPSIPQQLKAHIRYHCGDVVMSQERLFPSLIIKIQSHAINAHDFLKFSLMIFLKEKKKATWSGL